MGIKLITYIHGVYKTRHPPNLVRNSRIGVGNLRFEIDGSSSTTAALDSIYVFID